MAIRCGEDLPCFAGRFGSERAAFHVCGKAIKRDCCSLDMLRRWRDSGDGGSTEQPGRASEIWRRQDTVRLGLPRTVMRAKCRREKTPRVAERLRRCRMALEAAQLVVQTKHQMILRATSLPYFVVSTPLSLSFMLLLIEQNICTARL